MQDFKVMVCLLFVFQTFDSISLNMINDETLRTSGNQLSYRFTNDLLLFKKNTVFKINFNLNIMIFFLKFNLNFYLPIIWFNRSIKGKTKIDIGWPYFKYFTSTDFTKHITCTSSSWSL